MQKIKNLIIIVIGVVHVVNVLGMDEGRNDACALFLSQLPVTRKPRCNDFSDLVNNNAVFLKGLFAKGQHEYCPDLRLAELTLRQNLEWLECSKIVEKACDDSAIKFVYQVARKEAYCKTLIEGMRRQVDCREIRRFLETDGYILNHYFTCPESGYEITPLHYALADDKYLEYASILLEVGANPSAADNFGDTPLHKVKHSKHMELLLRFYAQSNKKNIFGRTPLMSHVCSGNNEGVAFLLETGVVALDSRDNDGNTALHHAVNKGNNAYIAHLLLQHGANFEVLNKKGQAPFCTTLEIGVRKTVEPYVQSLLCEALYNNDCKSVADIIRRYSWIWYQVGGTTIMAWAKQYCVHDGKPLESVTVFERSLVHQLCFADDKEETGRLILAGIPVNIPGYDDKVPLEWAIQCNNQNKILFLLQYGGAIVTQEMINSAKDNEIYQILTDAYSSQEK